MPRIKLFNKALVAAVGLLAVCATPALASSQPLHWRQGGIDVPPGSPVAVSTGGAITISVKEAIGSGLYVRAASTCHLGTAGTVENPVGATSGVARYTSFVLSSCQPTGQCTVTSATATNLPSWKGYLNESEGGTERYRIDTMALTVHTAGPPPYCPTSTISATGSQESEVVNTNPLTFEFGPTAYDTNHYVLSGNVMLEGKDEVTSPEPAGPHWLGVGL
jgi:hypothetical protein